MFPEAQHFLACFVQLLPFSKCYSACSCPNPLTEQLRNLIRRIKATWESEKTIENMDKKVNGISTKRIQSSRIGRAALRGKLIKYGRAARYYKRSI